MSFIAHEGLLKPHERLLVAVSGGLDSVVLCHLLHDAGLQFGLAHINYGLRGADADADEQFVEALATGWELPFYVFRPDTKAHAKETGAGTQAAARELRYDWLNEIAETHGYHKIATAHHADDNLETLLQHLVWGTGIGGMRGISPINGRVVRPLLFASRKMLYEYASANQLQWREDLSNRETVYQRNFIRLEVVPLLRKLNPSLTETFSDNILRFRAANHLYGERLEWYRKRLLRPRGNELYIPLKRLKAYPWGVYILFDLLRTYGFSFGQLETMVQLHGDQSGQQVLTDTHRLIKHRQFLVLATRQSELATLVYVQPGETRVAVPGGVFYFGAEDWSTHKTVPGGAGVAVLDMRQVQWPLTLRRWKEGDYFYPYGLTKPRSDKPGKKKLKRLFSDLKMSVTDKEQAWVVQSGDRIVWVAPYRPDHRFRVTEQTLEVLVVRFEQA